MAKTYLHGPGRGAIADLDWINDVTNVIKNFLGWQGTALTPTVDSLVLNGEPNHGLKIADVTPKFGWHDLLGSIRIDEAAASNKPTFSVYRGSLKQYQFALNDRIYAEYHLPHDYVPGTDIFVHTHWSTNATSTAGSVQWSVDASYAKGHGRGSFPAPVTVAISQAYVGQYTHMVGEVQLSAANGAGGLLNTNDLEPDGVIVLRVDLNTNGLSVNPFLHFVDIHYQSTGMSTLNKSPDFYT